MIKFPRLEIDLVTVGESSAQGVPFQEWLSIDRIVAWQLERVIPARPIHLVSLAWPGETLEKQHGRLGSLQRRADLLIIYCGHNEFKARFAAKYREVAARHGCILVDGQKYLRKVGTHGQLDDDLFSDMMHPSLRGFNSK
jgi:hypothetical protein